jgi:hypothetical protein
MIELGVKDAQEALYASQARLKDAQNYLEVAKSDVQHRLTDLQQARLRADSGLPVARMVHTAWRGERSHEKVVIAKRTPKQIVARRPGMDHEFVFRIHGNEWREYPRNKGMLATSTKLEIAE